MEREKKLLNTKKITTPTIHLSVIGICRATKGAAGTVEKKFDWSNAVADALILAGVTFCASFGGASAVGVASMNSISAAIIAGASQFCFVLAAKRKLIKEQP